MSPTEESQEVIDIKGPDISIEIYGGVLDYDGAGHYPGLELLNLVFSTDDGTILPRAQAVKIKRRALDFARKLVWDDNFDSHPNKSQVLLDSESEQALSSLLECLQLELPGMKKRPEWHRAHFFPYTRSLIHFDARLKKSTNPVHHKVGIERKYLRGGGALAFKVLRMDPSDDRLSRCREGFNKLYTGTIDSPLDRLAETLASQSMEDPEPVKDLIEERSKVLNDELDELLRNGVVNILEYSALSSVSRIRALVNWTSIWLTVMQMVRSSRQTDADGKVQPIVVDCGAGHSQLRRASQRCLKESQALILESIENCRLSNFGKDSKLSVKQRNMIKGFFWANAATSKLLNSRLGRKHFTLGLDALETLVLAGVPSGSQITFDEFVHGWLFEKCNMVIGRESANDAGLLSSFDASIFEDNESKLAEQMKAAGLMTEYSDATQMVGQET